MHDPPNSHPRSRLIPFLPLASILAPASCRMPFLPFNYRLSYTAALSCRFFTYSSPLPLPIKSLLVCTFRSYMPDQGAPIAEQPQTSHDMLLGPDFIKRSFPGYFLCTTGRDWNHRDFLSGPESPDALRIESTVPRRCVFPSFPIIYLATPMV